MKIGNALRWAIAIALLVLSFANASWLAPAPKGSLWLVAGNLTDCSSVEGTRAAIIAGSDLTVLDAEPKAGCQPPLAVSQQLPRYDFLLRTQQGFESFPKRANEGWSFAVAKGRDCFADYVWQGWLTLVPASCKAAGAIIVPIDQKWKVAGWPKRFQARMADAGVKIILAAPGDGTDAIPGLTKLEQIPEIPRDYTGYVWVDDIELIGRSIRR